MAHHERTILYCKKRLSSIIEEFKTLKRVGRPRLSTPKVAVTIRYDADIIKAFKAGGPGWQTRMNDALHSWLKTHGA
ncbi:MAG: BrnA antitoxin family protein [Alcaligenaceae bacterium]|nr:BrnA antitoxin family protein [Alcaligenaceae bacterium]